MSEHYWDVYEKGKKDINGHEIYDILARSPSEYVIYLCKEHGYYDLYYECTDELLEDMEVPDEALAKINWLLANNNSERKDTLEFVADALEMWFCEHRKLSPVILGDITARLKKAREGQRRLLYQGAAIGLMGVAWALYLCLRLADWVPPGWKPWMLAAALGSAGGVFSVCLNLRNIKVDVNQPRAFLSYAGLTRIVIAIIAGVACLLAIRGKILLGLVADGSKLVQEGLAVTEMFFCFLAGFSETFIPNILREAKKKAGGGNSGEEDNENGTT